jgi:predicted O-methyltransferase YrrM
MNIFKNKKKSERAFNVFQIRAIEKQNSEIAKNGRRWEIINFLLTKTDNKNYLEIGTRNPEDNFNKINADYKISVDPCFEFETDQIDFKLTSDDFFNQYNNIDGIKDKKWDVIFIDGLHLADQVYRDITNSLNVLENNGYIVLHDCNPPSEYHARENYLDYSTVARECWNGTVWKAFVKARNTDGLYSVCVDTDWGIGILSRTPNKHFKDIKKGELKNEFYEFGVFDNERVNVLNLISIEKFYEI